MKLISLNMEKDRHTDLVLEFLKKEAPDVICLQEFLEENFSRFKEALNLEGVFQAAAYGHYPSHPDTVGKREGVAIFAKNIANSGFIFYEGKEGNVTSLEKYMADKTLQENSVLLWVETKNADGDLYKVITTHGPLTEEGVSNTYQMDVFDVMLKELKAFPEFVFCGDLNAPRGRASYDKIAKKYRDYIPFEYKTSLDRTLHRAGERNPIMYTFMVDGLFTTPLYRASNVKLVSSVSDHMAVVADIQKGP